MGVWRLGVWRMGEWGLGVWRMGEWGLGVVNGIDSMENR